MDGWDGGIQEEGARSPLIVNPSSSTSNALTSSSEVGRSSTGLLLRSPSIKKSRKKSVRFNNAVTVKVVPRVSHMQPPKTSFITGTLLDPTTRTFRYLLLFLLCAQTYGPNFIRFSPTILQDQLQTDFEITSGNFYLTLFAVADIPALVLVLLGGYLMDKYFTVGKWSIGLATGVVLGQLVFALGVFLKSLAVLMAGRVLVQASSGCLYVAQASSMARWLAGLEMGLATGISLCLTELTMIFASWMLPLAAKEYGNGQSLVLGALMAVASLSATVLASALDAWGNDQLPKKPIESMYVPQTVVTTRTMTATMRTNNAFLPPLPDPSPPTYIASLPPQSPPQSPPNAIPQSPPNSPPNVIPQSPPSDFSHSPPSDFPHSPPTTFLQSPPLDEPHSPPSTLSQSPAPSTPSTPQIMPPTVPPSPSRSSVLSASPSPRQSSQNLTPTKNKRKNTTEPQDAIVLRNPTSPYSSDDETYGIAASRIHDSLVVRNRNAQQVTNIEIPTGPINTLTASPPISSSTPENDSNLPNSDSSGASSYGSLSASLEIRAKETTRQFNKGTGYQLLIMLVFASVLILPSGILSHTRDDFENIIYVAAAAAPAVGWVIDRAGRPCLFLGIGAIAQLAILLTTIFAHVVDGYTNIVDDVVQIIMGITWSVTVCGAYTGIALLVSGGWSSCAFAAITVVNAAALSLAPLFYSESHHAMEVLIPAAAATVLGLVIVTLLYIKRSVLNLNAHDIRRVIGYALDADERLPLLANSL